MKANEKRSAQEQSRTPAPQERAADPVGTEATQKGGAEPARREAERDWQDSSKESGE